MLKFGLGVKLDEKAEVVLLIKHDGLDSLVGEKSCLNAAAREYVEAHDSVCSDDDIFRFSNYIYVF